MTSVYRSSGNIPHQMYVLSHTDSHVQTYGLLLLGRAVLCLISDFSDGLHIHLLGITLFTCGLLLLKSLLRVKVYKKRFIEYIDTVSILNLLVFCLACFYAIGNKHATNDSQQIAACISVAVAFVTFVSIIVYHNYKTDYSLEHLH